MSDSLGRCLIGQWVVLGVWSRLEVKAWGSHSCGESGGPSSILTRKREGPLRGLLEGDAGVGERRLRWDPPCKTLGRSLPLAQPSVVPICGILFFHRRDEDLRRCLMSALGL